MTEKDLKKYVDYVESHTKELTECVNNEFDNQKDSLRKLFLKAIKGRLNNTHYEWEMEYEDNPYDYSGIIEEKGTISLNQTINEFLENEYTGERTPTYASGYGWHYETYEDDLSKYSLELACDILNNVVRACLEKQFNVTISDDELEDIRWECNCFDDIYSESITCDFFCASELVKFVGIGDIKLKDISKKKKTHK